MSNPIQTENANTGTTAWKITKQATTQIQAYAGAPSVNPGSTITFYVSTQSAGTTYNINIYRRGWYSGNGGRLIATISSLTGQAQGYWDGTTLQSCPTAIVDNTTHNLETGWSTSYTWTVPSNACTGIYFAIFTDANGWQNIATFVVRGNSNADYAVIRPTMTDAAYNSWGGYSLYTNPGVGVKVSLNRPVYDTGTTSSPLTYEVPVVNWLESQGYNMAYLSDIDVHATSGILLTYQAVLSIGHDEYWTKERRDATEAASAAGLGLAFMGANASYWQARLEADASSNPNRTVVCYKVTTAASNLFWDPKYGVDNTRVTSNWRDPIINRPENTMIGIMYSSYVQNPGHNVAWTVDSGAGSNSYLAGTGLTAGQSYGSDLVGYEYDKVFSGGPANLQIIGTSPITDINSIADTSNTTVYVAASGALVFASGSVSWTWALDTFRHSGSVPVVLGMQALMTKIMTTLVRPKNQTSFNCFAFHA